MHDAPGPIEILSAATALLRDELIPALPPEQAFKARILANALALVSRELAQDTVFAADNHARLTSLVNADGDDVTLLETLSARIEQGAIPLDSPDLVDHLWQSTLGKIEVDQPRYASFLAENAGKRH